MRGAINRMRRKSTLRFALLAQLLAAAVFVFWCLYIVRFRIDHASSDLETQLLGKEERVPPSSISSSDHALRLDWTNVSVLSPMAKYWRSNQRRCDWPLADYQFRNKAGMGSDLHTWTQALCNAAELQVRMRTMRPWIFLDEFSCFGSEPRKTTTSARSAMDCYFPEAEPGCPGDFDDISSDGNPAYRPKLYRDNKVVAKKCKSLMKEHKLSYSDVRASAIEYLFSSVSPLVVQEAERQLKALFGGAGNIPPSHLITVHIRWGDKNEQIDPVPIGEYVRAVQDLLLRSEENSDEREGERVGIFLSTEDPLAVEQFQEEAAKYDWKVYVDMYYQMFSADRVTGYNGNPLMAKKLKGRPGLVSLASLLVALQANDFVLTTISNWSRLMNELRKAVIDPRCNNCTRIVDLTNFKFEW